MFVEAGHTVYIIQLFTYSTQTCNTVVSCDGGTQTESIATVLVQSEGTTLLLRHLLLDFCEFGRHGLFGVKGVTMVYFFVFFAAKPAKASRQAEGEASDRPD